MNQLDTYISYGVMVLIILLFIPFCFRLIWHRNMLEKAFIQAGKKWPFFSQEELNDAAFTDLSRSYQMSAHNLISIINILFKMKAEDPLIAKHLKSIRVMLISFMVFPIILAFALIVLYTLLYAP